MKKIAMFFAAVAVAASACAQKTAITSNKAGDNIYVGINLGAATPLTNGYKYGSPSFSTFTPEVGVRVGKNFTTVFGLAVDATAYMNVVENHTTDQKTFIDATNISLLGTANLMNLFAGYNGQPRAFEIIALGGFGWGHTYGVDEKENQLTSKVALDFAYNFGADKQFQLYLEPSLTYGTEGFFCSNKDCYNTGDMKYNLNKSMFAAKVGFNYKFANSNGKHNFAVEQLRDQAEIDGLNAKINDLRSTIAQNEAACNQKLAAKDAEIAKLKNALAECENKPVQVVKNTANLQPTVVFGQGKSNVEKSQEANVSLIANYMKNHKDAKVKISGYASPEGNAELNQKLSEARANAVKDVLVKKYKISADRIETEGLGATDKLFEEVEFNRVAVFNDTTK